jgi:hypothetical protein
MNLSRDMFTYSFIFLKSSNKQQTQTHTKKKPLYTKKVHFFHSLLQSAGTFGRLATRKTTHTHTNSSRLNEKKTLKYCTKTEWNVRSTLNT